jgi:hypothetical protein
MFDGEPVYVNRISPADQRVLEEVTAAANWNYDRFRQVVISLGILGEGAAIPGFNRPESISVQGMKPYIDKLSQATGQSGVEYSQSILVDKREKGLVMGKITRGNGTSVAIDTRAAPGREGWQVFVGGIHTHPGVEAAHGLSPTDYRSLLTDKRYQAEIMTYGRDQIMMALKTSVTPNNLRAEVVATRLAIIEEDFLRRGSSLDFMRVIDFNKQVCAEFGLTMYTNGMSGGDLLRRVEVTR